MYYNSFFVISYQYIILSIISFTISRTVLLLHVFIDYANIRDQMIRCINFVSWLYVPCTPATDYVTHRIVMQNRYTAFNFKLTLLL